MSTRASTCREAASKRDVNKLLKELRVTGKYHSCTHFFMEEIIAYIKATLLCPRNKIFSENLK
jgi:hypothetical protein